jgi:hypothetical protein
MDVAALFVPEPTPEKLVYSNAQHTILPPQTLFLPSQLRHGNLPMIMY